MMLGKRRKRLKKKNKINMDIAYLAFMLLALVAIAYRIGK